MDCPEKIRLKQLYEAALRRQAQVQTSSRLFGQAFSGGRSSTETLLRTALLSMRCTATLVAVKPLSLAAKASNCHASVPKPNHSGTEKTDRASSRRIWCLQSRKAAAFWNNGQAIARCWRSRLRQERHRGTVAAGVALH
jgi:hypothetical protein